MLKNSKDDGQFFMVVFGKQENAEPSGEFTGVLLGAFAIAIVMTFFVTLVNDAERREWQYRTSQPVNCLNARIINGVRQCDG